MFDRYSTYNNGEFYIYQLLTVKNYLSIKESDSIYHIDKDIEWLSDISNLLSYVLSIDIYIRYYKSYNNFIDMYNDSRNFVNKKKYFFTGNYDIPSLNDIELSRDWIYYSEIKELYYNINLIIKKLDIKKNEINVQIGISIALLRL